ncbi:MAG: BON domain-containing protein [Acidobacteriota bacterium]
MSTWKILAGVVAGGLLGLASMAADDDAPTDERIQAAVEQRLKDKAIENAGGPWVLVSDGVVTLRGKVDSVWAKKKAVQLVLEADGVRFVEDELEIAFGESDEKVAEEVAKTIRRYAFFTVYDDVNIALEKGHLTLTGRVTMPYKAKEIEKRASKVMGVQSVRNEIAVLPTNIGDSRLRAALTYRIYGDSNFREYAFHTNPPIHIIVENGRVLLTGAVRSEVEKRKAEHIARSTFGVFSVENRLQVGS